MSGIWYQWSVLSLNFGKSFKSVIHHWNCVCWSACYPDTDLLFHGSVGVDTRSGHLASVILGNTLLYPTSVRDCPWTWKWCPHYLNNLTSIFIYFNLLSACLHPPPLPTTTIPTIKPHTPNPEIPATVCNIVIILLYFCGIRRYFLQILSVSVS